MKKKIGIALAVTIILAWIAAAVQVAGSEGAIIDRFPDIDPSNVKKAHKIMLKRTAAGKYLDLEMTYDVCDKIFLDIVQELK
jgi:hypothetical protein